MDRNRVIRATELTIAGLVILVSILGLMSTMYGMKYFKMMALDYDAVRSVVIPVVRTGVLGLTASAIGLIVGTIPFIRKMSFGFIIRLPITIYRSLKKLRNWLLEKVEYLQSEYVLGVTGYSLRLNTLMVRVPSGEQHLISSSHHTHYSEQWAYRLRWPPRFL